MNTIFIALFRIYDIMYTLLERIILKYNVMLTISAVSRVIWTKIWLVSDMIKAYSEYLYNGGIL